MDCRVVCAVGEDDGAKGRLINAVEGVYGCGSTVAEVDIRMSVDGANVDMGIGTVALDCNICVGGYGNRVDVDLRSIPCVNIDLGVAMPWLTVMTMLAGMGLSPSTR